MAEAFYNIQISVSNQQAGHLKHMQCQVYVNKPVKQEFLAIPLHVFVTILWDV